MRTDVKTLEISGGCNFRKSKYLRFCRAYHSGPWGRRFESSRPDQQLTTYQQFTTV